MEPFVPSSKETVPGIGMAAELRVAMGNAVERLEVLEKTFEEFTSKFAILDSLSQRVATLEGAIGDDKRYVAVPSCNNAARHNTSEPEANQSRVDPEQHHQITEAESQNQASIELNGHTVWQVEESAWNTVLFGGLYCLDVGETLFLGMIFVVNLFIQSGFVFLVQPASGSGFIEKPYTKETVIEASEWRLAHGHNFYDMDITGWRSLASRVCSLDETLKDSTHQVYMLETIKSFTAPFPAPFLSGVSNGFVLQLMVLIVWSLTVCEDFRKTVVSLIALCNMPKGRRTLIVPSGDGIVITQISGGRAVMVAISIFLRGGISWGLLQAGSYWLANTADLENLVLNAVALAFVFELDELIYEALAPSRVKQFASRLEPFPAKHSFSWRGISLMPVVVLLSVVAATIISFQVWVIPMQTYMHSTLNEMCIHGEVNLVVTSNTNLYFAVGATTNTNTNKVHTAFKDLALPENLYRIDHKSKVESNDLLRSMTNRALLNGLENAPGVFVTKNKAECLIHMSKETLFEFHGCSDIYGKKGFEYMDEGLTKTSAIAGEKYGLASITQYAKFPLNRTYARNNCEAMISIAEDKGWDICSWAVFRFRCSLSCECDRFQSKLMSFDACLTRCKETRLSRTLVQPCQDLIPTTGVRSSSFMDKAKLLVDQYVSNNPQAKDYKHDYITKLNVSGCKALGVGEESISPNSPLPVPIPGWNNHINDTMRNLLCGFFGNGVCILDWEHTLRAFCHDTCACSVCMSADCSPKCKQTSVLVLNPSPTPAPELSQLPCRPWCSATAEPKTMKSRCNQKNNCAGCSFCFETSLPTTEPSPAPTLEANLVPAPELSQLPCKPWCSATAEPQTMKARCNQKNNCAGCSFCFETSTPTTEPTPSPTLEAIPVPASELSQFPCMPSCSDIAEPKTRCNQTNNCAGCSFCVETSMSTPKPIPASTLEASPVPAPEPSQLPCRPWCSATAEPKTRCNQKNNCAGCPFCFETPAPTTEPTLAPTTEAIPVPAPELSQLPCRPWCSTTAEPKTMKSRCNQKNNCAGCSFCFETSAPTTEPTSTPTLGLSLVR